MRRHGDATSCEGSALLLTLIVTVMLVAIGTALASLMDIERLSAANLVHQLAVDYAADAALEEVAAELSAIADWTPVLSGGIRSPLFAGTSPVTPWGAALDLTQVTLDLQARTDAARPGSSVTTRWRLYLAGALSAMLPDDVAAQPFVAVWAGDDLAETDGHSLADSNGVILIRAIAIGARDARAEREAALERPSDPTKPVRVTVWRTVR